MNFNQQVQFVLLFSGFSFFKTIGSSDSWFGFFWGIYSVPIFLFYTKFSATFLNNRLMLVEFFADTSWYWMWIFYAKASTYSWDISLSKSILLPTKNSNPSCPLVSRTKSIHLSTPSKDSLELTSSTIKQQSESRTYDGMRDLKRYCPAVSHSCNLIVYPSTCMVLVRKSIPTVGLMNVWIRWMSVQNCRGWT